MTKYWQNLLALGRSIQVANFEYEFRIRRRGKIRIEKLRNLFIDCPQTKTSALLNLIKFQQPDIEKICQRSIQIKVSVAYHWKRKGGDNEIIKSKGIHWLSTDKWWCFENIEDRDPTKKRKETAVFIIW